MPSVWFDASFTYWIPDTLEAGKLYAFFTNLNYTFGYSRLGITVYDETNTPVYENIFLNVDDASYTTGDITVTSIVELGLRAHRITIGGLVANRLYTIVINTYTVDPDNVNNLLITSENPAGYTTTARAVGPAHPPNVIARGVNNGIYLSWGDPSGSLVPIEKFIAYIVNGFIPLAALPDISANDRSAVITGLTNGQDYQVSVQSDSNNTNGTEIEISRLIIATPREVPSAPDLSGYTDNSGQVILSWAEPATVPSGKTISGYVFYTRYEGNDVSFNMPISPLTATFAPNPLFNLFPYGQTHTIRITAVSSDGAESLPSSPVVVTPRVSNLSAALSGGQSIASFVQTSTSSPQDIAISSIAALKQLYSEDPVQKAEKIATLLGALKAKERLTNPSAVTLSIASSSNSGFLDLLTQKPENLPDLPVKIVLENDVNVTDLGDIADKYVYFNLPQKFTRGSRWIQFAADYTYTTSESNTPTAFTMDSLVQAGGLNIRMKALGSGAAQFEDGFTATYLSKTATSISFTLAGVEGAALPSSVSVDGYASITYNNTSGALTISELMADTAYTFTINARNYTPVTTSSVTTNGISPTISSQPTSQTVMQGETATFSVTASGTGVLSYQWRLNGTNIGGAIGSSYSTSSGVNGSQYSVVVTNEFGSVTSNTVTLTVIASGGGGVDGGGDGPVCFLASAPVLTPRGYRPIATLHAGDEVVTADRRTVTIKAVKYMECEPGSSTNPYMIPKGLYGARQDLLISPRHRVVTAPGVMVEARHLGLKQVEMKRTITYYNVELPCWETDNMIVAGVKVESLAPIEKRTVSIVDFVRLVRKQFGNVSTKALQEILSRYKVLPDGSVEVTGFRKKTA